MLDNNQKILIKLYHSKYWHCLQLLIEIGRDNYDLLCNILKLNFYPKHQDHRVLRFLSDRTQIVSAIVIQKITNINKLIFFSKHSKIWSHCFSGINCYFSQLYISLSNRSFWWHAFLTGTKFNKHDWHELVCSIMKALFEMFLLLVVS